MTIQDLGALGEFVSAIAVLGSLVYIALQVTQTNRQISVNSDLQIRTSAINAWTTPALSAENARVWYLGLSAPAELKPEEVSHFYQMLISVFLVWEARFDHYQQGNLDLASWQRIERSIEALLVRSSVREWYRTNSAHIHKPDFVAIVEKLMNVIESSAQHAVEADQGSLRGP